MLTKRDKYAEHEQLQISMPRKKQKYSILVPRGYSSTLQCVSESDGNKSARLAFKSMVMTSMTKERRTKGYFFPCSAKLLHAEFGSDWPTLKQMSIDTGLLEWNHTSYDGNGPLKKEVEPFSESARLTEKYRSGRFEEFVLSRKTRKSSRSKDGMRRGPIEDWLFGKLPMFSLAEDLPGRDLWDAFAILNWRQGGFYGTNCDWGRFHTNATALSRRTRTALDCGEQLYSLDVTNSQPLLLSVVLRDMVDPKELQEWKTLSENGQVYEWALDSVKQLGIEPFRVSTAPRVSRVGNEDFVIRRSREWVEDVQKWTRDDVKKSFLIMLFGTVEQTKASPVFRALNAKLPSLGAAILAIKASAYQKLARRCQRVESDIIIRGTGERLLKPLADSPAYTVHDSWTVPASKVEVVREAMLAEFATCGVNAKTECVNDNETTF